MSDNTAAATADEDWGAAMAEQAAASGAAAAAADPAPAAPPAPRAEPARLFNELGPAGHVAPAKHDIDLVLDIPVQLTVELGRTRMPIKNVLQLAQGSVVELDGLAGEPMNVLVNGCLIAQGEVVVVNDKFGIRLTDIITPSERIRRLNK